MDSAELELELSHRTFERLAQSESRRARAAQAALTFYSADGHLSINGAFRRVYAGIPTIQEDRLQVATFLYAVEPVIIEAPFPLFVYRGVGRAEGQRIFEALERGEQVFECPYPLSTSADERVARRFSNPFETPRGKRQILLYIKIPEGTRIIYLETFSAYPDEREILILPRTRLVFEKVSEHPLLRDILVQAVAVQEPLPAPPADVDETLIWHWSLCSDINEDEEELYGDESEE